jgi:EAL domain-containing protein (putative c-di-GMP-specific phosphodiesterase class I)
MYRAKDAGRNCLALYHDSMQKRLAQRMEIETALHSALDQRELRLYHQPIVDTATGHVSGFEALMRWQRSDGTLMSPAEFIPVAEETGIIRSIGAWALLEALTQLRSWIDDGVVSETTTVSVNVSAHQLADPSFCDVVEEALRRSDLPNHLLWLEVTETMMIDNPELAKDTLTRLSATGVGVALDDFGTGYSSLSLLQQFPIQRVKIDRAFVDGVASNKNDRSLVRTIIAMGSSLNLDVVAEGVETVEQLKMLRKLGCAKAQGYLISHPVPAEAMRSTVAALESLSQWEAFDDVLGDRPDRPTRIN